MDEHKLPHSATAAPIARRLAERAAGSRIPPARTNDLVLMVTEAVSNAIRHAPPLPDGYIGLRFESDQGVLRTLVIDGGSWVAPDARSPERDGDAGLHFGLKIIDALSDRWGVTVDRQKTVWFEVDARAS
jgi:anti-sigma regulatory factor (Ser/Thr protein kinase)